MIARPQLDAYLEFVRARLLTIVKAPAGFGKTTMALAWAEVLAGDGARVAWLSLGPEDDEDERFLRYVAAALRRAGGDAPAGAPDWMVSELSIPIDRRVEWLIEEMAAQPEEIFLFLDDVQEITRPSIHDGLTLLLRRAPENVHLVLLGRADPGIDVAWLRVRDGVFELDAAELRFDLTETEQLLRKAGLGAEVVDQAAQLQALTGGWIAALRTTMLTLRTLSVQKTQTPAQYLRRLPTALRTINQLFADLTDGLPPDVVEFMERISVCERFCAPLAERLSGRGDAQALLERLDRQQLFIGPQDDEGRWFAFHRLFREYLQRGAQKRTGTELPAIHRAAAHWFAEQGLWSEAIQHVLAAGDIDLALRWIEQHAMAIVGAGDLLTLLSWERQLRSHLVQSPPRLRLAFAWGLGLAMDCDKALVLLDGVEADIDSGAALDGEALRRECRALRAVLVTMTGDYELGEQLAEECVAATDQPPWVVNAIRNVIASARLHAAQWERMYAAPPLLAARSSEWPADRISLAYRLSIGGLAEYRQGHLDEAARLLERAMDIGAHAGLRSAVLVALPAPTLARVRYEQDRIEEAARINAEHMDINRRIGPIQGLYGAYLVAARIARLEGQPGRARALLEEAEGIGVARGWRRVEIAMLLEKVRICLVDGRSSEAAACLRRIEALASAAAGKPALESADFSRAAALARGWTDLADRRYARAVATLEPQLAVATASGRLLDQCALATALALAKLGAGQPDDAVRVFLETAEPAYREGALRSLLDQPAAFDPLLAAVRADRRYSVQPWLVDYTSRLMRARREPTVEQASPSVLDALSPRERNILKLIADGRSNKEIARGLGITPETVKTHVKKIFTKLGVQNRAQAAALAVDH